jgi:hypothetical protein
MACRAAVRKVRALATHLFKPPFRSKKTGKHANTGLVLLLSVNRLMTLVSMTGIGFHCREPLRDHRGSAGLGSPAGHPECRVHQHVSTPQRKSAAKPRSG